MHRLMVASLGCDRGSTSVILSERSYASRIRVFDESIATGIEFARERPGYDRVA